MAKVMDYKKEFLTSSFECNEAIARESLKFAVASMNTFRNERFFEGPAKLNTFFADSGFDKFLPNEDFLVKPEPNTFGVGIASKVIYDGVHKYTLIAMGLRGGKYGLEWCGNFDLGVEGNHHGFENCANKAYKHLAHYIYRFGIKGDVILWATGYSRAAASCNLLGGMINAKLMAGKRPFKGVNLAQNRCFFYTFETPRGVELGESQKVAYKNIYNFINPNDIITYMGPEAMGFGRFGIDVLLPAKFTLLQPPVKLLFERKSCQEFLGEFMEKLVEFGGAREDAMEYFEAMQTLITAVNSNTDGKSMSMRKRVGIAAATNADDWIKFIRSDNTDDLIFAIKDSFSDAFSHIKVDEAMITVVNENIELLLGFLKGFIESNSELFEIMLVNIKGILDTHDHEDVEKLFEDLPKGFFDKE